MRCLILVGAVLLSGTLGAGCQRSSSTEAGPSVEAEVEEEPATELTPHSTPSLTSREPKTRVADGIPVEEDYEEEAERLITPATLETELAKLAAEIDPK